MRISEFITRQSKNLLDNKQTAIVYAVGLSLMPFISWLSVAIVALITLRKGAKAGLDVLIPALVVHSLSLMMMIPVQGALVNSLISFVPCYLASISLRNNENWQQVFGVYFSLAFLGFLSIQLWIPEFIPYQFSQFKNIISEYQEYQEIIEESFKGISPEIVPQIFFGIQIISVFISSLISLCCARSIQSRLFVPGGFKKELELFRSGRLSLLIFIAVSYGAYSGEFLFINILPLILAYFLLSGINLVYVALAGKRQAVTIALLVLLILLKPSFFILAYIVFGALDSLFNFRTYLPGGAKEST